MLKFWQADYKPNSVPMPFGIGGDHSSRPLVSQRLEQPTRKRRRAAAMFPYLALLRVGFTKPARYRTAGALLPHLFTLTRTGGVIRGRNVVTLIECIKS